jgi:CRISPR-associated protein (TIGR03986 family)
MPEIFTGKLSFDKGKWKIVFFDERKQKERTLFCQRSVFSAGFEPIEGEETEIHFERDTSPERKAARVRPKDSEWQEPKPKVRAVPARNADRHERAGSANQGQTLPGEFHNPFNFVPAPPRDVDDPELGDHPPAGHERYHLEKYTGKLCVRMQVETPLLLPDTARMHYEEDSEHKSYPVRVRPLLDKSGNVITNSSGKVVEVPDINPTAIKGMLRSAYEAVTNSRLSVFKDHDERLAFRGEAKLPAAAARIEMHSGSLHIHVFRTVAVLPRYRKHWQGETDKLERENTARTPVVPGRAMRLSGSSELPQHRQAVWVKVADRIGRKGHMAGKRIGKIVDEVRLRSGAGAPADFVKGWACITGANAKDKVYERVFIESPTDELIPLTGDHVEMWKELISNYQEIHAVELKRRKSKGQRSTDYLGNDPSQTAWSIQIFDPTYTKLEEGTLCYVAHRNGKISALVPVMISRRLHGVSPGSLLPESLRPANKVEKLSPAERVFGWVRQGKGDGVEAYRGQVRFGTVECTTNDTEQDVVEAKSLADLFELFGKEDLPTDWLPLQILGQPKPQQGRFYVAEDETGKARLPGNNNEEAGYQTSRGLRGRKVYTHHGNLPEGYWIQAANLKSELTDGQSDLSQKELRSDGYAFFREYIRPKTEKRRDSQNRSVQGWVKKGVEFRFDIHFVNLSKVELGALIWLLSLNEGFENKKYFHRFGGGKPLGFGSVSLDLDSTLITSGGDLKEFYQSLDVARKESLSAAEAKTAFENAYLSAGYQATIAAFKRACEGFADGLPIHYPRARHTAGSVPPHRNGLAYEWFVENAKAPSQDNPETRLVLSDLVSDKGEPDRGLPIHKKL